MKGRITFPYSDCLKSPLRVSAIDQTNALNDLISLLIRVPGSECCNRIMVDGTHPVKERGRGALIIRGSSERQTVGL
jgi:hypothetical protein